MQTNMRKEINEIPEAAARLLENSASAITAAGRALRERDPQFFVTVARGSSDHAALFLKYAIELTAGQRWRPPPLPMAASTVCCSPAPPTRRAP